MEKSVKFVSQMEKELQKFSYLQKFKTSTWLDHHCEERNLNQVVMIFV